MQPARDIVATQMTRSRITFGSIQEPWMHNLINKTLTAKDFELMQPTWSDRTKKLQHRHTRQAVSL